MQMDRRTFMGGAALSVGLAACAHRSATAPPADSGDPALELISSYMDAHRAAWGIPGMTLAVATRDGYSAVLTSGFADLAAGTPVRPDHLFQIGSISKMFTALSAWSLIEEGRLTPETRLHGLLGEVDVRGGGDITLQHLLNHTSGLPADAPLFSDKGLWTGFAPGSSWSYSNTGYDLAGRMMAEASGQPFADITWSRVMSLVGMTDSTSAIRTADRARHAQGYEPLNPDIIQPRPYALGPAPWVDSDSPAGCISATPGDMAKFLRFLIDLSAGKGGPVLSDAAAQRFLAYPADGWNEGDKYGNGIARVRVDDRDYLHHTGGMVSFCSSLHVDIEAGVAAFASSNVHYSFGYRPVRVTLLACEALRARAAKTVIAVTKPPFDPPEEPAQYAGRFTAASGDYFDVQVEGEGLALVREGRKSALQRVGGPMFASSEAGFARSGVLIETNDGKPIRAWVGEAEYLVDPATGYKPPAPDDLRRLAGRYVDDDRWGGPVTVYARDGRLFAANMDELVLHEDGSWRSLDDTSPERIWFEGFLDGVPQVLNYSGTAFQRRDI